jgi:hypothetical protein
MKGSAAPPPNHNYNPVVNSTNDMYEEDYNQDDELLQALGFEEGEIEMFFDPEQQIRYPGTRDDLITRYLQIARSPPYNLQWQTSDDASDADYMLGVFKNNGVEYTKHDIVKDVFYTFHHPEEQQGGRKKKSRRSTKKRTNKKKRNTRRNRRFSRK